MRPSVSPRYWKERIKDVLDCAHNIVKFTDGMSLPTFLEDAKTVRAVAYELTTIGEAVRTIPWDIQKKHPEVPWGKLMGIRNVLVHEYFRLDEEIIWETCQHDIPELIIKLKNILLE